MSKRNSTDNFVNDDLFLDRLISGDEAAFRELVTRYSRMVYNLILRMVRNKELAEDLTQDAFVKAYKGLPRFRRRSSLPTWLLQYPDIFLLPGAEIHAF